MGMDMSMECRPRRRGGLLVRLGGVVAVLCRVVGVVARCRLEGRVRGCVVVVMVVVVMEGEIRGWGLGLGPSTQQGRSKVGTGLLLSLVWCCCGIALL